ncbi:hypothetical protein Aduo_013863 [Ancylostoma duodenale]
MQLLILATLAAVVGAGQVKIGDDSSDSIVEVHISKWEVRQDDRTEPPAKPPPPLMMNPPTKRPRKHRKKRPKHNIHIHRPMESRTTTPETITEKTTRRARTTTKRRATTITHDWISHIRNTYKVFRNAKSFDDAENRCKQNGAHLVSIHSELENQFVRSLTTTGHDINNWEHFVYIGLRMDKRTGKWYWTDGSKVDFTKWAKYQPDQPKTEHCAQLYQDLGPKLWTNIEGSRWNSIECGRPMKYFVCKR